MNAFPKTKLNTIKRLPDRGHYDKEVIYPIIDEALICHVGFVDNGQPFVIPTIHARNGDVIYLHGSRFSRMLEHVEAGEPVCLTFTLLDGLVFARSVFHSSMNYRSAVVFGKGRLLKDDQEKNHALASVSDHVFKGRWDEARRPTKKELAVTNVAEIKIESASAKRRAGGPKDDEEDYALPIWAGVLPLIQQPRAPISDERLLTGIEIPAYVKNYKR